MICNALCPSDIHPNAPLDKEIETTGFQNMVLLPVDRRKGNNRPCPFYHSGANRENEGKVTSTTKKNMGAPNYVLLDMLLTKLT